MKEYTVEEATQDLLNHAIHIVRRLNAQHYDVNLTDALAAYEKQITLSVEMNDKAYIRLLYAVFLLRRIIETEED